MKTRVSVENKDINVRILFTATVIFFSSPSLKLDPSRLFSYVYIVFPVNWLVVRGGLKRINATGI